MNAVTLTKYIAGFAVVLFTMATANAQQDSSSESSAEAQSQVLETIVEKSKEPSSKSPHIVVTNETGKRATIDLDSESGSILIRHNEDGESEQVNINLGSIGKTIIAEIVEDLEREGVGVDEAIRIEIDNDDNITLLKDGEIAANVDKKNSIKSKLIKSGSDRDRGMGFMEAMTAITAIVLIFGTPLLIVIAVMYGRHKRRALVHQSVNKLIDSGQEIPPEIFDEATGGQKDSRKKGIMMVSVGVAIAIVFTAIWDTAAGSIGLIPLMIGLAHIAIWKTDPSNKQEA